MYRGRSFASLVTPSSTPTSSLTASTTASPSSSGYSTATASLTVTRSATRSRTTSGTPTRTPSPSPTLPICRGLSNVRPLAGTSGVAPRLSTAIHGTPAMYTSGTCATGLAAFFPGSRLLYALHLGDTTPLGGRLTLTTCGHSANNTVLYVGTGCPAWALPFACKAGNDNAAAPSCGGNPLASTVAVVATQPVYYVQLGGMSGSPVVSGLGWSYAPPPSASGTRSRSKTPSRSATRSRSRKRKLAQ